MLRYCRHRALIDRPPPLFPEPAAPRAAPPRLACQPPRPCPQAREVSLAPPSGNKIAAIAHGMGSGGLAIDAMVIGYLGVPVDCRVERLFVLSHFFLHPGRSPEANLNVTL